MCTVATWMFTWCSLPHTVILSLLIAPPLLYALGLLCMSSIIVVFSLTFTMYCVRACLVMLIVLWWDHWIIMLSGKTQMKFDRRQAGIWGWCPQTGVVPRLWKWGTKSASGASRKIFDPHFWVSGEYKLVMTKVRPPMWLFYSVYFLTLNTPYF